MAVYFLSRRAPAFIEFRRRPAARYPVNLFAGNSQFIETFTFNNLLAQSVVNPEHIP